MAAHVLSACLLHATRNFVYMYSSTARHCLALLFSWAALWLLLHCRNCNSSVETVTVLSISRGRGPRPIHFQVCRGAFTGQRAAVADFDVQKFELYLHENLLSMRALHTYVVVLPNVHTAGLAQGRTN